MPTSLRHILIADNDANDRQLIAKALPNDCVAVEVANVTAGLKAFQSVDLYAAFVDVFLEDRDQRALGFELGKRLLPRIPVIYISDKKDRTREAIQNARMSELRLLDKNQVFDDPGQVGRALKEQAAQYYADIRFDFVGNQMSWSHCARQLASELSGTERDSAEAEFGHLLARAMRGWEDSSSRFVRAVRVELVPVAGSGDHSVVLRARPYSATDEAQADVIVKFTREKHLRLDDTDLRDDHTMFNRYKNVMGGYGLRERRHARRCNFQVQIYAIPYFEEQQTQTFAAFYRACEDRSDALDTLRLLTNFVFEEALRPLNKRRLTGEASKVLAEDYRRRIDAPKRLKAIGEALTRDSRPSPILMDDTTLTVQVGKRKMVLPNPTRPVLDQKQYPGCADRIDTQLRHGDFHTGNILVDRERCTCWYLDFETMGEKHYHLADHVEFEADLMFNLMDVGDEYSFMAAFVDGATTDDLAHVEDKSALCGSTQHKAEAHKAYVAIAALREHSARHLGAGPVQPYYHALMYEALRVAGRRSVPTDRRWRALLAAAVIFSKLRD